MSIKYNTMNFKDVTKLVIPQGEVIQIQDSLSRILWKKQDEGFRILTESGTEWSGTYSTSAELTAKYYYLEYRNYDLVNNPGIQFQIRMQWASPAGREQYADTYICANTVKTFSFDVPFIGSSEISGTGKTVTKTLYPASKDGYLIIRVIQGSDFEYGVTAYFKVTLVS